VVTRGHFQSCRSRPMSRNPLAWPGASATAFMVDHSHSSRKDCAIDPLYRQRGAVLHAGVFPHIPECPGEIRWCGPAVGQHTEQVLREFGISRRDLLTGSPRRSRHHPRTCRSVPLANQSSRDDLSLDLGRALERASQRDLAANASAAPVMATTFPAKTPLTRTSDNGCDQSFSGRSLKRVHWRVGKPRF
jgi:hypothetical protein